MRSIKIILPKFGYWLKIGFCHDVFICWGKFCQYWLPRYWWLSLLYVAWSRSCSCIAGVSIIVCSQSRPRPHQRPYFEAVMLWLRPSPASPGWSGPASIVISLGLTCQEDTEETQTRCVCELVIFWMRGIVTLSIQLASKWGRVLTAWHGVWIT